MANVIDNEEQGTPRYPDANTDTTNVSLSAPTFVGNMRDGLDQQNQYAIHQSYKDTAAFNKEQDDANNTFTSDKTGYTYKKYEQSQMGDTVNAITGYLMGYLVNNDVGEGMQAAYHMTKRADERAERFKQVSYLEDRGYNPTDIASWVEDGKQESLVQNKITYQNLGDGYVSDNTGNVFHVGGNATLTGNNKPDIMEVNAGGETHLIDKKTMQTLRVIPHTNTPAQEAKATMGNGSNIPDRYLDENGSLILGSFYDDDSKQLMRGKIVHDKYTIETMDAKSKAAFEMANGNAIDAEAKTTRGNFDYLNNHMNDKDQNGDLLSDKLTHSVLSQSQNDWYYNHDKQYTEYRARANQLQAGLGNAAISLARASGISGINTLPEYERYAAAVGHIDYSTPETLKSTLSTAQQAYEDLIDSLKAKAKANAGGLGDVPHVKSAQAPVASANGKTDYTADYNDQPKAPTQAPVVFVRDANGNIVKQ